MSKVRFTAIDRYQYDSLGKHDSNTLYFLEDEKTIAKGNDRFVNMRAIKYDKLVALRNSKQLKEGCLYIIYDYVTTVMPGIGLDTAGNNFGVIVQALDDRTLSEDAWAIDVTRGYYNNHGCNLAAWRLRYCLDNDTNRFDWADPDGKGVIYSMEDEWGNRCPYDFKNILFEVRGNLYYTFTRAKGEEFSVTSRGGVCSNVIESIIAQNRYIIPRSVFLSIDELYCCHIASPGVHVECGGETHTNLTVCAGNEEALVVLRANHVTILPGFAGQTIYADNDFDFWGLKVHLKSEAIHWLLSQDPGGLLFALNDILGNLGFPARLIYDDGKGFHLE